MSTIVPFINLKGGVAKTTNAVAIAECLAEMGYRVLVVDADHQCMAGELLLGESRLLYAERRRRTLHDLLIQMLDEEFTGSQVENFIEMNASNIAGGMENLAVLPCSIRIDDFQTNIARARKGYRTAEEFQATFRRRRTAVRRILHDNFDFTIVDCPPSVALQVKVFLTMADTFIVPSIPDRLSVRGSLYLLDRLRRSNFKITGLGTLWSLYRTQNHMHRKVVEATAQRLEPYDQLPPPFESIIPNAAAIAESTEPKLRPHTFASKYGSPAAKLYRHLSQEIIKRSQWEKRRRDELPASPARTPGDQPLTV